MRLSHRRWIRRMSLLRLRGGWSPRQRMRQTISAVGNPTTHPPRNGAPRIKRKVQFGESGDDDHAGAGMDALKPAGCSQSNAPFESNMTSRVGPNADFDPL